MSEFETKEFEVVTPETTEQVAPQAYEEPQYTADSYDYPEQSGTSNSTAFIAGVFAAGAAAGTVATTLIGKVKQKIAAKKSDEPPMKVVKEFHLQWPWRIDKHVIETKTPAGNVPEATPSPAETAEETK